MGEGARQARSVSELNALLEPVTPANVRSQLVATWAFLEDADHLVDQGYRALSNHDLGQEARALAAELVNGTKKPEVSTLDEAATGRSAGILLRALEQLVHEIGAPRTIRNVDHLRYEAFGDNFFLIPTPARNRKPPPETEDDMTRAFARRGLLGLRILPQKLGKGHSLKLAVARNELAPNAEFPQSNPDVAATKKLPLVMAGCLFQEVDFKNDQTPPKFRAVETLPALGAAAETALSEAIEAGADVILFPELCVKPDDRDRLRDSMTMPARNSSAEAPSLLVAGSWHEAYDHKVRNRAYVFDGFGNELGFHDKNFPYMRDVDEAIDPSNEILAIYSGGLVFGLAICLDHCNVDTRQSPYEALDLDYLLVTSCGAGETLAAHEAEAKRVDIQRHTVSAVVQQEYPVSPSKYGYLLVGTKPAVRATNAVTIVPL